MTRNNEGKFDLEWWATADLEGVNERLIPSLMRQMATEHYWTPGALPDIDKLNRVRVNMQRHAARTRRADTVAQVRWLLAIASAVASMAWLLWQVTRLLT